MGTALAPVQLESNRLSNGLKELLWNLQGLERGALLDLGPVWQTTLSFFIERGFRVSSEDVLRAWKTFLNEEETRLKQDFAAGETLGAPAPCAGALDHAAIAMATFTRFDAVAFPILASRQDRSKQAPA